MAQTATERIAVAEAAWKYIHTLPKWQQGWAQERWYEIRAGLVSRSNYANYQTEISDVLESLV